MSIRQIAALVLCFPLLAEFASAESRSNSIVQIRILDSVTRAANSDNNGVPTNCEQITFDAYCRSTNSAALVNTLIVQEGDAPPFRVSCTESRSSRCTPLPKGEIFDAKKEKRGITVYFEDDKGKERKQLYTLVEKGEKMGSPTTSPTTLAAVSPQPLPAAVGPAAQTQAAPIPAPAQSFSSNPHSSASNAESPSQSWGRNANSEKVRCNFTSTPAGADITIDGSYVGNTPSEIGLSVGRHVVQIATVGFDAWKRELTVTADSAVNVTANLQKSQP